jgi:outer membrane protein TolC
MRIVAPLVLGGVLFSLQAIAAPADPPEVLSLADAVTDALRANGRIQDACDAAKQARFGMDVAQAEFAPQFSPRTASGLGLDTETSQSTVLSLSKKFPLGTIVDLQAGTASSRSSFYRSYSGVTLSQNMFRGFGRQPTMARVEDATSRTKAADWQMQVVRDEVVTDVIESYYRVVGKKSLLTILEAAAARAKEHQRAAEARLKRGLATRMEGLRAESLAALTEGSLLDAREGLQATKDALGLLLGKTLAESIDVEPEIVALKIEGSEDELVDLAERNRADLRAAEDEVTDARRSYELMERSLYPDLRVGVNFALVGTGNSFTDSARLNDHQVSVLVSGTNPVDRSAERAQLGQARLELSRRRRSLDQLRDKIALEVRDAARHLGTVERRIAVQEQYVRAASAAVDLAKLRFEKGYADTLEVLQAEEGLSQAQQDDVNLRIERVTASVRLRRATGSLADFVAELVGDKVAPPDCS